MENKKVLLSVKDLHVKFRVRGRILTAIRGISLDFYENESVAIVGESGSGKSVFTKTFAGMLDGNGFIDQGSIIFNDEELADTTVFYGKAAKRQVQNDYHKLNEYSRLELGADTYKAMEALKDERKARSGLSGEEMENITKQIDDLTFRRTELFNQRQTVDRKNEKERFKSMGAEIAAMDAQIKDLEKQEKAAIAAHKLEVKNDTAYKAEYDQKMAQLQKLYAEQITGEISEATKTRNLRIA